MVLPSGDQLSGYAAPPTEASLWAPVPSLLMTLMSPFGVEYATSFPSGDQVPLASVASAR